MCRQRHDCDPDGVFVEVDVAFFDAIARSKNPRIKSDEVG